MGSDNSLSGTGSSSLVRCSRLADAARAGRNRHAT